MTEWHLFDDESKKLTAPRHHGEVWVANAQEGDENEPAVEVGWFDGYTFNTHGAKDDCNVIAWAEMEPPALSSEVLEVYLKDAEDDNDYPDDDGDG
jgi:hypothetical protein